MKLGTVIHHVMRIAEKVFKIRSKVRVIGGQMHFCSRDIHFDVVASRLTCFLHDVCRPDVCSQDRVICRIALDRDPAGYPVNLVDPVRIWIWPDPRILDLLHP